MIVLFSRNQNGKSRSEEHTSELQSRQYLHSFPTRRSSDLGSADPDNPSLSGGRYLIGIKGVDDCSFLSKPEWEEHLGRPCRLDWEALTEGTLKPGEHVAFKGKKAGVQAKSSFDAGVKVRGSQLNPIADNA